MGLSPLTSSLQVDCTRLNVDFERYRLVSTVVRLPALCVIDQPYLRGYRWLNSLSVFLSAASGQRRARPFSLPGRRLSRSLESPGGRRIWKGQKPSEFAADASCDAVRSGRTRPVPKEPNPSSSNCAPRHSDRAAR